MEKIIKDWTDKVNEVNKAKVRICFQLVTSFPNVSVPDAMPRKLLVTGFCLSFSTVVMDYQAFS